MRIISMFIVLVGVISLSSCEHKEHHPEKEATYQVTSPIRLDTSITKEYVCQIHAIQHIEVRAQEHGYLEKIYVDEGQFVKKGQLMFQIMPNLYAAEVKIAAAEAEVAEIEYQNTKALADSNVVSPNELAMAQARLDRANAELALAQVHLDFTEIRAPFDGLMDRFHVRIGSLLEEGELLTSLADNSKIWVYFNVPEAEYLDVMSKVNRDSTILVRLRMANNRIFPYSGYIETIEADFNNETGNIPFRATFENPDRLLRHGETGNLLMSIGLKNALIIPQKATYEILEKRYVYVVNDENIIEARQIEVSQEMPHLYVVSWGLNEGDKILLEGLRKVRRGDEIHYTYIEPEKAINSLDLYAE